MPSVLSDNDKEIVKRTVPKGANKIHAVAVARLYIAYPNKQRWVYTGLQGAAVLANDLSIIPPKQPSLAELGQVSPSRERASSLDTVDPSWRGLLGELLAMGITEDQIEENSDFIKDYIEQRKASGEPIGGASVPSSDDTGNDRRSRAPPPPPPGAPPGRLESISPQNTGGTVSSRRGPAPAPPPSRRSRADVTNSVSSYPDSPSRSPERTPSPPRPSYQFRAPPPLADAGKFANVPAPSLPKRPRATSNVANPVWRPTPLSRREKIISSTSPTTTTKPCSSHSTAESSGVRSRPRYTSFHYRTSTPSAKNPVCATTIIWTTSSTFTATAHDAVYTRSTSTSKCSKASAGSSSFFWATSTSTSTLVW
ncbi:hypothetical protein P7C71_g5777, partial [Lecanoromycetidae sp. Uapishka_2]